MVKKLYLKDVAKDCFFQRHMTMKARYFIGTSGWSYNDWPGNFYPESLPRSQWLDFYVQHFNTVEMNMSFYRFPSLKMVEMWKKKLPPDFLMTMKANREFTHVNRFKSFEGV